MSTLEYLVVATISNKNVDIKYSGQNIYYLFTSCLCHWRSILEHYLFKVVRYLQFFFRAAVVKYSVLLLSLQALCNAAKL